MDSLGQIGLGAQFPESERGVSVYDEGLKSDPRPVCGECFATMLCLKNEVRVDCGNGYVKSGDKYACPKCKMSVVVGFGDMWSSGRPTGDRHLTYDDGWNSTI